ncbi:S8 family serine peptidase [Streptosporangiaceae bacterium NEAU-GS5]|nr:S8 family serine peptidase [Streptosporangiaceae bacterium NEAU-GS5]
MPGSLLDHSNMKICFSGEIVVDLPHQKLVETYLQDLGVESEVIETSEPLRLTRLRLRNIEAALGQYDSAERYSLLRQVKDAGQGLYDPNRDPTDLDVLLFLLRETIGRRNANWIPAIGSIRQAGLAGSPDRVSGLPYSGGAFLLQGTESGTFQLPDRTNSPKRRTTIALLDTALYVDGADGDARRLVGRFIAEDADAVTGPTGDQPPLATALHSLNLLGVLLTYAPEANVLIRRTLDEQAIGDVWTMAKQISESARAGADVIVIPACAVVEDGRVPLVLRRAIEAVPDNCQVIAAAGNYGNHEPGERDHNGMRVPARNSMVVPAACERVIGVGALDKEGDRARYSQAAEWMTAMAAGDDQISLFPDGPVRPVHRESDGEVVPDAPETFHGQAIMQGTSVASAVFAGVVANLAYKNDITAVDAAHKLLTSQFTAPAHSMIRAFAPARDIPVSSPAQL